jgi:antibiotic biosynthesis monooxygenase (ABM) superfamily enzyme
VIAHLLLIKPREDLGEHERRELESTIARLATVPGVRNLSWGKDFSGRSKGYHYAAVMQFDSRDTLAAYGNDPTHRQIVSIFDRLTQERLVVDYDTGMSGSSI